MIAPVKEVGKEELVISHVQKEHLVVIVKKFVIKTCQQRQHAIMSQEISSADQGKLDFTASDISDPLS